MINIIFFNFIIKLTIIPRSKGSLGFAQYLPNESSLESKEELLDRITCIMGGRSSEEIFFKKVFIKLLILAIKLIRLQLEHMMTYIKLQN